MEEYILEKYKEFEFKEIQSGYRCKTYLINKENEKYIYQMYFGHTKYQANKKGHIIKLIKEKTEINEIPNIIELGENEEFSYLVSELKSGQELAYDENFDYEVFYKDLASILVKIHSVEIGNKFRMDRNEWIG
jgi:hypothetical protein